MACFLLNLVFKDRRLQSLRVIGEIPKWKELSFTEVPEWKNLILLALFVRLWPYQLLSLFSKSPLSQVEHKAQTTFFPSLRPNPYPARPHSPSPISRV